MKNGFTLIELMIVIAIVGILFAIFLSGTSFVAPGTTLSFGTNGAVETRCINDFSFVVGADGGARQIVDSAGNGVHC
jgi:prepilin-type N-terminal cleavage/methylation domain-containing protein